jgi:hypothetical protein
MTVSAAEITQLKQIQTSKEGTKMAKANSKKSAVLTEKQKAVRIAGTLEMMSHTLSLLSEMSQDLVEKDKYQPENVEALLETIQGIGKVANGLTKLIAEQTLLVQTYVILDNVDTSNDSK